MKSIHLHTNLRIKGYYCCSGGGEELSDSNEHETNDFVVELEETTCTEEASPKSSLNAMKNFVAFGTMRFTSSINGQLIKVLLDGGSDDNFIQPRIAKFLQLDIQPIPAFKVLVGDWNFPGGREG